MTSQHFNIQVHIQEVTINDGPSVYDNVKRQSVPTKGEKTTRNILDVSVVADSLTEAIRKAKSHLYAEDPSIDATEVDD